MERVFICSPFASGDRELNIANARAACEAAIKLGFAPFAPHLLYPQILDNESDINTRRLGIDCGLKYLETCSRMWIVTGSPAMVSDGMRKELTYAMQLSIPPKIEYYSMSEISKIKERGRWASICRAS